MQNLGCSMCHPQFVQHPVNSLQNGNLQYIPTRHNHCYPPNQKQKETFHQHFFKIPPGGPRFLLFYNFQKIVVISIDFYDCAGHSPRVRDNLGIYNIFLENALKKNPSVFSTSIHFSFIAVNVVKYHKRVSLYPCVM